MNRKELIILDCHLPNLEIILHHPLTSTPADQRLNVELCRRKVRLQRYTYRRTYIGSMTVQFSGQTYGQTLPVSFFTIPCRFVYDMRL